jgi:preprotein translocase subunit YajC
MFNITTLFLSPAWADTAVPATAPAGGADFLGPQAMVFVVILALFYMLMIRPQQKKIEQHNALLKALQKGDQVITAGGFVGTVFKIENDEYVTVELAEGLRVKTVRSTITGLVKSPAATPEKKN